MTLKARNPLGGATATLPRPHGPFAPRGSQPAAKTASATQDLPTLEGTHVTASQSNDRGRTDNGISSQCPTAEAAEAARHRFLAQHGPGADIPRRITVTKELRKALLAAEMARWECF